MHKIYEASGFESIRINFPFNKEREYTSLHQIKFKKKLKKEVPKEQEEMFKNGGIFICEINVNIIN